MTHTPRQFPPPDHKANTWYSPYRFLSCSHVSHLILALLFAVPLVTAALAVVGRFGVNVAYSSGAQYAAELIPTEVRGQGVASIHMVGYAATFFSAHILYLVSRITDAAARVTE